jgi:hypothetical protein
MENTVLGVAGLGEQKDSSLLENILFYRFA